MITPQLVDMMKKDEGFRGKPYLDTVGKLTFGYGLNLDDSPLTEEEGEWLLRHRLEKKEQETRTLFSNFDDLNDVRQGVLISMCYQLGVAGLAQFRNFRQAIKAKDWKMARFHGLDSKWAREDSPARANRLMLILETGRW